MFIKIETITFNYWFALVYLMVCFKTFDSLGTDLNSKVKLILIKHLQ